MKPPVIVLPGITASVLKDFYPLNPQVIWGNVMWKDYERIRLHPDNSTDSIWYEQQEPAMVRADEGFSIPYDELVGELRHDLTRNSEEPRPIYLFGYDWRQPLEILQARLRVFVVEVIERTKLQRHYHRSDWAQNPQVDLVGHSMGGLVIAGYLAGSGSSAAARVRKVATIATPFGGSFEAVLKVVVGTSELGGERSGSRERETARVTPGLYHLLPRYKDAVLRDEGSLPDTLFDPGLWQPGVLETIAEHIRLHGLAPEKSKSGRLEQAREFFTAMLDQAREYRDKVDALRLDKVGLAQDDWLAIVGLGEETRIRLFVENTKSGPFFNLRSDDRLDGYPAGTSAAKPWQTGDGTVPFPAACPPFLPKEQLVCVSKEDFGYWEIKDRLLRSFASLHAALPSMNRVIKLCGAFLEGEAGQKAEAHRGIRGRRAPDLKAGVEWAPPFKGLKEEKV